MHEASGNTKEVSEGAGVRETGFRVLRNAEVRPALAAPGAVAAGAKALCDDCGSFADVLDTRPDQFDCACPFVPGDDRIAHVAGRSPALEHFDV